MDGAAAATGQKITGFCNNWYTLDTLWSFAVITTFLLNQLSILINRVSVSWLLVYSSRSVHFKILSLMGEPIKLSVDGFILVLTLSWWIFNVSKLSMCGPGQVCLWPCPRYHQITIPSSPWRGGTARVTSKLFSGFSDLVTFQFKYSNEQRSVSKAW